MTSHERVQLALKHREADRVSFDLGSMNISGISATLLRKVLEYYQLEVELDSFDIIQRTAAVPVVLKERLGIDTVRVGVNRIPIPAGFPIATELTQEYLLEDVWHAQWEMRKGDHYFNQKHYPLAEGELEEALKTYQMPLCTPEIQPYEKGSYQLVVDRDIAGLFEFSQRLRGMENLFVDLMLNQKAAEQLADLLLGYKLEYWEKMLDQVDEEEIVVAEADDYGSATSLLISPEMVRSIYLSRYKELFAFIKKRSPKAKICFHSCGAIRPLIPDFIEIGVDAINPVQYSAEGMDLAQLKRDFGKDITFWGACVDTTEILPYHTPSQVADEVKRVLDIMAPGGGFIAAAVHNVQSDVPLENFISLVETLQTYGKY